MKVIITGAAGFIGSAVAEVIASEGTEVLGVDNLNSYYDPRLKLARLQRCGFPDDSGLQRSLKHPCLRFARVDILDGEFERIVAAEFPDMIIHLAARPGVRQSLETPEESIHDNIHTFTHILEICHKYSVPNLLYASSSSVYGDSDPGEGYREDMQPGTPLSVYAVTKRTNEMLAEVYSKMYGINIVGMRFFSVYGEWGRPDMAPMIFGNAILDGERIRLFGGGRFKRDFTYIGDVAECIRRIANTESQRVNPRHSVVNIGRGSAVKMLEFLRILEAELGQKGIVEMLPLNPGEARSTLSDSSKAGIEYGYQPDTDLRDGLRKFSEWIREWHRKIDGIKTEEETGKKTVTTGIENILKLTK